MRLPILNGLIRRRMLINFRVDPAGIQNMLPPGFRPKLHRGFAIAGICLIRLEKIRPVGMPAFLGGSSENAAHRIAVQWDDERGETCEGVYIPRRDTGSLLNFLAGGRFFPGEHHAADFQVSDDGHTVDFRMQSHDGVARVTVKGTDSGVLTPDSCFESVDESSRFLKGARWDIRSVGSSIDCRDYGSAPTAGRSPPLRSATWNPVSFRIQGISRPGPSRSITL